MRALHAFPCSRAKLPHGVSYIFPPPRPFSPAYSLLPSCLFARALFNLEPSVIDAVHASSLGCLIRPGINLVGKTGLKTTTKELSTNSSALLPTPPPIPKFSSLHLSSLHVLTRCIRPHRGTSLGPFVCGARAGSLCSLI
jgi:hypothetical protein